MEDGGWVLVRPPTEIEFWSPGWGGDEDEGGSSDPLKVRFFGPAKHWTDALPIGNGRLGAMVWGGVASETLQLNEGTLWTGTPGNYTDPDAPKALSEVRKLVDNGDYVAATEAAVKLFGNPPDVYQLLGDINLEFDDSHLAHAEETYSRELDLDTATVTVKYSGAANPVIIGASFCAAVAEMIVQSTSKDLHLLPALPREKWANGCVKGLKARGGVTVNVCWKEGDLHQVGVWSKDQNSTRRLHYRGSIVTAKMSAGRVYTFNRQLKCVKTYTL